MARLRSSELCCLFSNCIALDNFGNNAAIIDPPISPNGRKYIRDAYCIAETAPISRVAIARIMTKKTCTKTAVTNRGDANLKKVLHYTLSGDIESVAQLQIF
ncbi:hypothetical protein FXW31_03730 [Candidatus Liberibacter asiaticus]|nr:hypothetical protein FXW31_03730 [Candidatus Liberibacter asiaticus]